MQWSVMVQMPVDAALEDKAETAAFIAVAASNFPSEIKYLWCKRVTAFATLRSLLFTSSPALLTGIQ